MTGNLKRDTIALSSWTGADCMSFDQIKYISDYSKEHYERINLSVPKGLKEEWKKWADKQGKSMSAFVMDAVEERIQNLKGES